MALTLWQPHRRLSGTARWVFTMLYCNHLMLAYAAGQGAAVKSTTESSTLRTDELWFNRGCIIALPSHKRLAGTPRWKMRTCSSEPSSAEAVVLLIIWSTLLNYSEKRFILTSDVWAPPLLSFPAIMSFTWCRQMVTSSEAGRKSPSCWPAICLEKLQLMNWGF